MVSEENFEERTVYKCEECGFYYKTKSLAKRCESFCKKHKSCNLNLTKHAIKLK